VMDVKLRPIAVHNVNKTTGPSTVWNVETKSTTYIQ